METTEKKPSKKSSAKSNDATLVSAYIQHILNHGSRPASVYKFCSDLNIKEEEFYNHFGSFDGLEQLVWKSFITQTINRLKADESYASFSSRERILAFYYTLFEELKSARSFILVQLDGHNKLEIVPGFLKEYKKEFENYLALELNSGISTGEVAKRPFLDTRYPKIFWWHMAFLLNYWRNDNSPAFEQTDAAIEKSVNLAFDLIGKGAVDSVIDFAKFLYQTKVK
jgi:hypothetical protein